jgi:hypothetical protein
MCKKRRFSLYWLKSKHVRNVMEGFDYIIIGLGIALIAIGLFLFISGKRESEKSSQVEGFGIKLNVSNPSIILIVFGIGLVLFPRLMPTAVPSERPDKLQPVWNNDDNSRPDAEVDKPDNDKLDKTPAPANVFFPQGMWYLTQYQENGVDLTNNIQGNIRFNQLNASAQNWFAEMAAVDGWGNVLNYTYSVVINALPGGYSIDTTNSNDPTFSRQRPSQLIMKMDNPNSLHMEYTFNGSSIIIHWAPQ